MGNTASSQETLKTQTLPRADKKLVHKTNTTSQTLNNKGSSGNGENSRVFFLLYLIHRTWNVVVDSVEQKGKRSVKCLFM